MKDLGALMKQAQAMQEKLQAAQERLARSEVEGAAGGGMVRADPQGIGSAGAPGHRRESSRPRRGRDPRRPDHRRPRRRQAQARRRAGRCHARGRRPPGRPARHAEFLDADGGSSADAVMGLPPDRDRAADRSFGQAAGPGAALGPARDADAAEEARTAPWPPERRPRRGRGAGADLRGVRRPGHHRSLRHLRRRRARRAPCCASSKRSAPCGPWSGPAPFAAATTCWAACCRPSTGSARTPCASGPWWAARPTPACARSSWPFPPPSMARPPPTISPTAWPARGRRHHAGQGRAGGRRTGLAGRRHHHPGHARPPAGVTATAWPAEPLVS